MNEPGASAPPRWPNLFLIGAARAGTTALYTYLVEHPDIYMTPAKEPGFFALPGELYDLEHRRTRKRAYFITSIDDYQALFRHHRRESIVGEATPAYLPSPVAAARIRHYAPDARILVSLRSPAARMYSHYMMESGAAPEVEQFLQAVEVAERSDRPPPILSDSYYAEGLRRYFDKFDRRQVHVVRYDELTADAASVMRNVYRFLQVDPDFEPNTSFRPNRSGRPRSRWLHSAVGLALNHRLMRWVHLYGPAGLGLRMERFRHVYLGRGLAHRGLPREHELALNRRIFRRDIEQVEQLIGRDLSNWLR